VHADWTEVQTWWLLCQRAALFSFLVSSLQNKTSPTKPRTELNGEAAGTRNSITKRQHSKTSTSSLDGHLQAHDSPTNRRLTPVLTITVPSTEELRTDQPVVRSNSKPPPSPQTEDRHAKISTVSAPASTAPFKSSHGANGNCEHGVSDYMQIKCDQNKRQVRRPERFAGELRILLV
jgi:hypothetical protein